VITKSFFAAAKGINTEAVRFAILEVSLIRRTCCVPGRGESCSISANVGEGQEFERGYAYCAHWYSAPPPASSCSRSPRPASSCSRSPQILNWLLRSTCAAGLYRCVGLSKFTLAVVPWWVCSYTTPTLSLSLSLLCDSNTTPKRVHGSPTGLPKHHSWVFRCQERRRG